MRWTRKRCDMCRRKTDTYAVQEVDLCSRCKHGQTAAAHGEREEVKPMRGVMGGRRVR